MAAIPNYLVLAKIMRPHGIRGELNLQMITDFPERLRTLETVFVGANEDGSGKLRQYPIEAARPQKQATWLIKLAGIDDRDTAEQFRNQYLFVSLKNAVPLDEGEVYLFQVMGIRVITTAGEELGKVVEFIETGANEVYVVQGTAYGEVLIPNIKSVVRSIDTEAGVMTVELLPGLLPEK
jgi:16S rRNA processing protein RimM